MELQIVQRSAQEYCNRTGSTYPKTNMVQVVVFGVPMFISQAGEVMPLPATNAISVFNLFSCENTLKIE